MKSYIDTKDNQHAVEWFLIIAPDFIEHAAANATQLEIQVEKDIRPVRAAGLRTLAKLWQKNYPTADHELPLLVLYGSGIFDVDAAADLLEM